MNKRIIVSIVGKIIFLEALLMVPALLVSLFYGDGDTVGFLITVAASGVMGALMMSVKPHSAQRMSSRDGYFIVASAWILISLIGALPLYLGGGFPSYWNALFEIVSGFTTTGASVLARPEDLGRGVLFWRSFTHWIGGMGILVFVLAILPNMDASNVQLLRAESPGPTPGKVVPRLKETARILYLIYFGLTILHILCLLATGMPLFDSVIHSMGSAGTGGFSNMNASVGAYGNPAAEWVIAVFMMLFGVNFSLYYLLLKRQVKDVFKNEELRLYLGIIAAAVVCMTLNIARDYYDGSWPDAIRSAFFQVSSIITTTGYSSTDFNLWPTFSKMVIVVLMIVGASAGSTGGGIKVSRLLALIKALREEFRRLIHPRRIHAPRMDGRIIEQSVLKGILIFFATYMMIAGASMVLISIDGYDIESTITAVLSALGNIGPGLGTVGPMGNFSGFSMFSKLILSFCMLAGRLELFPMLILFNPSSWKKTK